MLRIFFLVIAGLNLIDGFIKYIKNEPKDVYMCISEASLDLLVVLIIDKVQGTQYSFFGYNLYDWPIFVLGVLCLIILPWSLSRAYGRKLTIVAKDKDGNIIQDENGVPLTGKAARKHVKEHSGPTMSIVIEGEENKEASEAATKYMKEKWYTKRGKRKKKDENGNPVTDDTVVQDVKRYIYNEWAPQHGYPSYDPSDVLKDLEDAIGSTTIGDSVRQLDNRALAEFFSEIFHSGCESCDEKDSCANLSPEERKEKELDCVTEMLDESLLSRFKLSSLDSLMREEDEDEDDEGEDSLQE